LAGSHLGKALLLPEPERLQWLFRIYAIIVIIAAIDQTRGINLMKALKEVLYPEKRYGYVDKSSTRFLKVADYAKWLLLRVLILAFLWVLILIPVIVYFMRVYEGREISSGQAAVFIVQTLTTTGYGELLPFHSFPMVILSILLMVSGVFLIFMTAGTLMASLVENRVIPRAPTQTKLKGHVVFTSFNEIVARAIVLFEHHGIAYVVAAEEQPEAVELMRKGINCICANPKFDEGLNKLNVSEAKVFVATNPDTDNINITLGVSTAFDTPVLAVMENEKRAELASAAGASHVITLEETLGKQLVDWICADASPTRFLELLTVEVSEDILAQLKPSIIHVGYNSDFCGKTIGDVKLRTESGATIVAIWNDNGTVSTPGASTLISESTLIVLGLSDNVDKLATMLGGPGPGGHVVLIGAGRVGQESGKRLNEAGIEPFVVDVIQKPLYFKGNLILGDATKPHILHEVEIEKADTLIVTINDDSLNIFTVLACRQLNPDVDVMARAVHVDAVDRLHMAGANHVLSESILGFQLMQIAMVEMGVLPKLTGHVVREVTWTGEPVTIGELTKRHNGQYKIICGVRDGRVVQPTLDLVLEQNEKLVVMAPPTILESYFH
jgi:voltage-gated potassium channel